MSKGTHHDARLGESEGVAGGGKVGSDEGQGVIL